MQSVPDIASVARRLLHDPRVGWSVGRAGAIAEFYWTSSETTVRGESSVSTPRGAFRLESDEHLRIFAGESLGHNADSWTQWIAFALPADRARMAGRCAVAEVGRDRCAIRAGARMHTLVDLGIGGRYYEVCVRTDSAALMERLRSGVGKPFLQHAGLVCALIDAGPPRVFASRIARIEVEQGIAPPDGHSPEGPHTHVLPKLLETCPDGAGCAPSGWSDQAVAYPPHPLRDTRGQPKAFDSGEFSAFQDWMSLFGDADVMSLKARIFAAVRAGSSPASLRSTLDPSKGDVVRIALRQLRCLDGESDSLVRWRIAYSD